MSQSWLTALLETPCPKIPNSFTLFHLSRIKNQNSNQPPRPSFPPPQSTAFRFWVRRISVLSLSSDLALTILGNSFQFRFQLIRCFGFVFSSSGPFGFRDKGRKKSGSWKIWGRVG